MIRQPTNGTDIKMHVGNDARIQKVTTFENSQAESIHGIEYLGAGLSYLRRFDTRRLIENAQNSFRLSLISNYFTFPRFIINLKIWDDSIDDSNLIHTVLDNTSEIPYFFLKIDGLKIRKHHPFKIYWCCFCGQQTCHLSVPMPCRALSTGYTI